MTKWEGLALLGVGYLVVRGRQRPAPAARRRVDVDRSPPMAPSPVATIVDAPDGAHFHLVGPSGDLLGVFDTIPKAAEVGRGLGYTVVRP